MYSRAGQFRMINLAALIILVGLYWTYRWLRYKLFQISLTEFCEAPDLSARKSEEDWINHSGPAQKTKKPNEILGWDISEIWLK